jgi:hypothetical protein
MAFKGKDVSPEKHTGFVHQGKEIIISKTRGRPLSGKSYAKPGHYPDTKKIEVVTLYAVTGNMKKVAELAGIPYSTVQGWRKQEWFVALLEEIRTENDQQLDAKMSGIIDHVMDAIRDRLMHGDTVVGKHGELIRKPVAMRDLSVVMGINIDKRNLMRGKPTSRTETTTIEQRLEKLMKKFSDMSATKPEKVVIPIDGESLDDVPQPLLDNTNAQENGTGS